MIRRRKPLARSTKRIRTRRPAGTKRREAKAAGWVDPETWAQVCDYYRMDDGRVGCAYMPNRPRCEIVATEQDHVVPISKGGEHFVWNLVPICHRCNQEKGQRTWEVPNEHPWMMREEEN